MPYLWCPSSAVRDDRGIENIFLAQCEVYRRVLVQTNRMIQRRVDMSHTGVKSVTSSAIARTSSPTGADGNATGICQ